MEPPGEEDPGSSPISLRVTTPTEEGPSPEPELSSGGRHLSAADSSSNSSSGSLSPGGTRCCSPVQGPRFKLVREGPAHVCRLNHTRTVISKLLSSRFLRRWEGHQVVLENDCIASRHASGFLEEPVPYHTIQDVYSVARWDACGRFCIRIVIPDGSMLLQVSNCYSRDQWLHSLLWKRGAFRFKKLLGSCTRPEILLKELKNLVDVVLATPLQDDGVFQTALDIISDVLVKGQAWMSRSVAEDAISTVAVLLERATPTSHICDFFTWHCREHPRSTVVLDICTPVVQRILKHNMDFGKHPQTRVFVQEYLLAVNCQNRGGNVIRNFVQSMHGPGSTCPHPRVLHNLVAICVAAIYAIFESRKKDESPSSSEATLYLEWDAQVDCFASLFTLLSSFDDWRPALAELLQPIPFHEDSLACDRFTSHLQEVVRTFVSDDRCGVHQMLLGVREEKGGWIDLYCPGNEACKDEGRLWSDMLDRLLSCCCRRRQFLASLACKSLGPCLLLALRDDEPCQRALCAMLEADALEGGRDLQLQLVTTLQSTHKGKRHYAELCDRQAHIKHLQQKGGPKKLALPSKSTDADVSRLLKSGSFGDLECLSLAFTQVTSACAEDIIKLSSLRYLNLWSTQFGDSGLRLLSEHLPNLQVLNLCETRVTDGGLAALTAMKSLRKLNLNSTSLTPETFEGLKRTLPVLQECDVRYTDAWGF